MGTEKTPGTDGLPGEFYKVFWKDISAILIRALNYAYETGQLSVTQRRGIIKLIPKKDAEPFFIKNWRPLTLLNCDYKIAAKSIANRLKPSLPNLINYDQTGFIKGTLDLLEKTFALLIVSFAMPKRKIFQDYSCSWILKKLSTR